MRAAGLIVVVAAACTTSDPEPQPVPDPAPAKCSPGELTLDDGSCQPAGVQQCGDGFQSDGAQGCIATLPAEPCAAGQIALPGDAACRSIVDCGSGDWGAIPIEGNTQHVKADYPGSDSDGSAARPWTTLLDALAAADNGAIVALADGSYVGDVNVTRPVRLWGRCPERVEIVGTGTVTALWVRSAASEVRNLAITGAMGGLLVSATDVHIENVWAHDTAWHGIHVEAYQGPASATLRSALVERAGAFGVYVYGAAVVAEDLAVRDTQPDAGQFGYGVHVENLEGGDRGNLSLAHALIERSSTIGLGNVGSDLTVSSTLVRDTLPTPATGLVGRGINAEDNPYTNSPATLAIDTTVVERSYDMGIYIAGVTGSIANTVVRDTAPAPANNKFGRALNVLADYQNGVTSNITLTSSLFERSYNSGVAVFGSTLAAELIVIRTTQPDPASQSHGTGIVVQHDSGMRANATLRASVIEDSSLSSVLVLGSDLELAQSRVARTAKRADGLYGDGVTLAALEGQPSVARIGPDTAVIDSARAGIAAFGANVLLENTVLECNLIDMHTESWGGLGTTVEGQGENSCRCSNETHDCKASSSSLTPPDPLPPQ